MEKNQTIVHKKGQASWFIFLGFMLIVLVILYFNWGAINDYAKNTLNTIGKSETQIDKEGDLQECLSLYTEQGLKRIESQGGYLMLPRETIKIGEHSIGIFSQGTVQHITLEEIQNDLTSYIAENTKENCFANQEKYLIDFPETIDVQAEFTEESLEVTADWPVNFRSKDDPAYRFILPTQMIAFDTDFKALYEEAERIQAEGAHIKEQYYTNKNVNATSFAHEQADVILLNKNEEYFIIAIDFVK